MENRILIRAYERSSVLLALFANFKAIRLENAKAQAKHEAGTILRAKKFFIHSLFQSRHIDVTARLRPVGGATGAHLFDDWSVG